MDSLGGSAVPLSGLTYCILIKGHGRAGNVRLVRQTYASMRELQVGIDPPNSTSHPQPQPQPQPQPRSKVAVAAAE